MLQRRTMKIIGRKEEERELMRYSESSRSEFVVVSGRRRIGKTFLVRETFNNEFAFYATGVAGGSMKDQLEAFNIMLKRAGAPGKAKNWFDAFEQLIVYLERPEALRDAKSKKLVVFIDEMPWMDTPKSRFIPALEFFWNSWASARDDILLIACGSATSWVIKNLFKSKGGLHNRVTGRIHLDPFTLGECEALLEVNGVELSRLDIIKAYMVFGGIPYYLELFDPRLGLAQNIDRLCFAERGQLHEEFDQLYKSLFRHSERHVEVVRALARHQYGVDRATLISSLKMSDGGTASDTLEELCQCGFIRKYRDFTKPGRGEIIQLIDPFTLFWLRFVEKKTDEHWWSANRNSAAVRSWSGRAFELVCLLHVRQMLTSLGIWGISTDVFAWKSSKSDPGAQIDLVLSRADNIINLCEMKFSSGPYEIDRAYCSNLQHKVDVFARETGKKSPLHLTLVSPEGVKRNKYSEVIQAEITADDLFTDR